MTEQRVRVTSPRSGRPRRTTIASEIDAETTVGTVYVRSLVRAQLRLALTVVVLLAVTVGALPLLFLLAPAVRRTDLFGVPLPWVLLGVGAYPVVLLLAWFDVRRAERIERDFADLVEREERP